VTRRKTVTGHPISESNDSRSRRRYSQVLVAISFCSRKSVASVAPADAGRQPTRSSDDPDRYARERDGCFSRWLEGNRVVRNSGISRIHPESGDRKRRCANEKPKEELTMTKRLLLSISVILSTAIASPAFAQAVAQEPGAYALYLPDVGTESAQPRRSDVSVVNGSTSDVMPTPRSVRPWKAGSETATRPWSAPAGHHQPTAADVIESDSQWTLDQESANVDRIVRGICRGC
jgi:hypothetical protein